MAEESGDYTSEQFNATAQSNALEGKVALAPESVAEQAASEEKDEKAAAVFGSKDGGSDQDLEYSGGVVAETAEQKPAEVQQVEAPQL